MKADNLPAAAPGVAKKPDGAGVNAPASTDTARSGNNAAGDKAAGNSGMNAANGGGAKDGAPAAGATKAKVDGNGGAGTGAGGGTGPGAGNSTSKSPFPGITIQGGRVETGAAAGSAPSRTGTITLNSTAPAAAPKPATYGITIVSTASSGGGLPDLGVFSREQTYTVYIDMKQKSGAAAPSWTLQYAMMQSTPGSPNSGSGLTPPFPVTKESPDFPVELVRKNLQRLMVVYAVIDTEGKLQQISVKQSPDPQLNPPALAALAKWVFRPAEVNGEPAAVKMLLGIPLSLP